MKIRIKDNSVRFRLTQTEVKTLSENEQVTSKTNFGDNTFNYQIILVENIKTLQAVFSNHTITLKVPKTWGKQWYTNEIIGANYSQKLPNGETLSLLLEKDFTCLDNTIEDQSDNYPNPKIHN